MIPSPVSLVRVSEIVLLPYQVTSMTSSWVMSSCESPIARNTATGSFLLPVEEELSSIPTMKSRLIFRSESPARARGFINEVSFGKEYGKKETEDP